MPVFARVNNVVFASYGLLARIFYPEGYIMRYNWGIMPKQIKITAGNVQIDAELYDTPTGRAIADALPITGHGQRWGDEIYFSIATAAELEEDSRDVLEAGELAYWPDGKAFCIFFGKTPASQGDEIRAASAVNIVGKMKGDFSYLTGVASGDKVLIEQVCDGF